VFCFSLQHLLEPSFTWINVYHTTDKMFTDMHASLHAECFFHHFHILTKTGMGQQMFISSQNVKFHKNLFISSQVMQKNNTQIFCNVHYQCDKKTPLPEQV
jgi:hypothetical protein